MKPTPFPETVFEDEDILVLNKPAGLLVLPDRYDATIPNLFELLNTTYGRIYVVHRIDKETSGLIVFAKTEESHRALNQQFESRMTEKTYCAICVGEARSQHARIESAIAESSAKKGAMRIDQRNGKEAVTTFDVLEQFDGFTYVEAKPETGRTHQIRVHLSSVQLPILGDSLYGGGEGFFLSSIKPGYRGKDEEKPLLNRTALHATKISFTLPKSAEGMSFNVELPKDMRIVLNYLRKFRGSRKTINQVLAGRN